MKKLNAEDRMLIQVC